MSLTVKDLLGAVKEPGKGSRYVMTTMKNNNYECIIGTWHSAKYMYIGPRGVQY